MQNTRYYFTTTPLIFNCNSLLLLAFDPTNINLSNGPVASGPWAFGSKSTSRTAEAPTARFAFHAGLACIPNIGDSLPLIINFTVVHMQDVCKALISISRSPEFFKLKVVFATPSV